MFILLNKQGPGGVGYGTPGNPEPDKVEETAHNAQRVWYDDESGVLVCGANGPKLQVLSSMKVSPADLQEMHKALGQLLQLLSATADA